ncbi:hypothetical protein D3C72_809880 [compost metagenome]
MGAHDSIAGFNAANELHWVALAAFKDFQRLEPQAHQDQANIKANWPMWVSLTTIDLPLMLLPHFLPGADDHTRQRPKGNRAQRRSRRGR